MKNYLQAGSGKIRRSCKALLHARFTPGRVFVGVLSLILILLSFIGAFATINSPHVSAAAITVAANSGMKHTLAFDDTSTPTTTPSPTSTMTPSPTSSISPTRVSSTGITNATPVATRTVTDVSPQSFVQGQTPTTKSNSSTPQSMPQQQQKNTFPFIALAIGVPGLTATLVFLLIGWWLLRKRLLPNNTVQLPPSGANPWSRVRPNDAWNTKVNGAFRPDGNNSQLSASQMPLGNNASDVYEQWLLNNFTGTPDLNDPYLKELLNQCSDKTRATLQQNLANFRNE